MLYNYTYRAEIDFLVTFWGEGRGTASRLQAKGRGKVDSGSR